MSIIEVTKLVNRISEYVRESSDDSMERHMSVSAVIGGVIGTQLQVPSSPVKNSRLHYQEQIYPVTVGYLNEINEAHTVDLDLALECSYLIWLDRYKLVHATRVDVKAMLTRLSSSATLNHSQLDTTRLESLNRILEDKEDTGMNLVFLELLKQLQTVSEE